VDAARDIEVNVRSGAIAAIVAFAAAIGCSSCRKKSAPAHDPASDAGPVVEGEIEPTLAAVGDRTVLLAFMHVDGASAKRIVVRISRDAGTSWHEEQSITPANAELVADPSLAVDAAGNVDLVFLAFSGSKSGEPRAMSIQVAHAPHDSLRFDRPTTIPTPDATHLDKPWSTIDATGRLVVVDRFETPALRGIEVHTRDAKGVFSRATIASSPAFDGTLPTVCASLRRGNPWVVYVDPDAGNHVVGLVRDDVGTWSAPILLSNEGEPVAMEAPSCVVDDEGAHVVYGLTRLPFDSGASPILDGFVRLRIVDRDPDMHQTWTAPRAMHPAIAAVPGGTAVAFYQLGEGGSPGRVKALFWKPRPKRELPVVARKDDPAWAGDYLGVAYAGALVIASVDASTGDRHVVVDSLQK
jgi:hypothetical protein